MLLLEDETIRLRALEPEDLDQLYRWENNSDLWELGSTLSPYSRFLLKSYIANSHLDIYEQKQLRLMIELLQTKEAVGTIDLYDFDPRHRRAGVGILIDDTFHRKGIAGKALRLLKQYAFSFLNLHQLYAHVPVTNEASLHLFGKEGYRITGALSEWLATAQGYVDVNVMQLFNENRL
ncbi:GNAT family N-acetyltransferase [Parabacteroides sp. Marseille-P3160]|uniref:GNAT family N-acetyltransferase n=1 Tax=Parabacteroides sp. Marseille-P3160 TaxID=1917887 RepID=UPI0009B9AA9A|nr:GNAT family N-acetyltransferase [Parabacteroides sp. Marseille-P3160]